MTLKSQSQAQEKREQNRLVGSEEKVEEEYLESGMCLEHTQNQSIKTTKKKKQEKLGCKVQD